jgi:hypothetical protein
VNATLATKHGVFILIRAIILFSLSAASTLSLADSISCGDTLVTASDAPSANEPFFSVKIEGKSTTSNHQFEIQKDYLNLRCEITSTGNSVIFINHFCGGSACADFGNFGIIEASTGKVLLEPNQPFKGNAGQAKEIMGKELNPFTCKQEGTEICLHTKIELG